MKRILFLVFLPAILFTCSEPDPCEGIVCENGGTCVNGSCKCTQEYEGVDCTRQATPSNINMTKLEVIRFPATNTSGGGWDASNGADILVVILDEDDEVVVETGIIDNANPAVINFYTGFLQLDAGTDYKFLLYDYDPADPNDFIGGVQGPIYNSTNGFPATLDFDAGGAVAFRFTFEYEFD